jgi:hypothetical protein
VTRRSYVQIDGVLYEKGTEPVSTVEGAPAILPDLADFVSPIDGRAYSGRRGLREHCARHDVVPNADLKGLPVLTTTTDTRSRQDRARDSQARKEFLIHQVNQRWRS